MFACKTFFNFPIEKHDPVFGVELLERSHRDYESEQSSWFDHQLLTLLERNKTRSLKPGGSQMGRRFF